MKLHPADILAVAWCLGGAALIALGRHLRKGLS